MGKHTPSTEELEVAIAQVLEKSSQEDLSAKGVRQLLRKDHGEWKVPGERRVAKFMKKRQTAQDSEKRHGLFRMFSGRNQKGHDNSHSPRPPESVPADLDSVASSVTTGSKERKKGFKTTLAKVFSPTSRSSKKRASIENPQKFFPPDLKTPVPKALSEIEESEKPHAVEELEKGTPAMKRISEIEESAHDLIMEQLTPQLNPLPATNEEEEEEIVTADTTKQGEDELIVEKQLSIVQEAYLTDDNDGKKEGDCVCKDCVIL